MTQTRSFSGPARCFDNEEACFEAVNDAQLQGRRGPRHPLRGTARRPRHARDAVDHGGALRPGHGRQGRAHHRRPLLRRHARLLRRPCRARRRRSAARSALIEDGDIIDIDAVEGTLDGAPHRRRAGASAARPGSRARPTIGSGAIWKYAQTVGSAKDGAVTHPGAAAKSRSMRTSSAFALALSAARCSAPRRRGARPTPRRRRARHHAAGAARHFKSEADALRCGIRDLQRRATRPAPSQALEYAADQGPSAGAVEARPHVRRRRRRRRTTTSRPSSTSRGSPTSTPTKAPDGPTPRFVASAFVALGGYFLEGIPTAT